MSWLHHPRYTRARDRLISRLSGPVFLKHLRHLVFICGKRDSGARRNLKKYLSRHHPKVQIFYAESVWEIVSSQSKANALEMEEHLARLSDIIIIIVESPGTCAELGAFALNSELREKLLPIIDAQYENEESFINTGPVQWVNADSRFEPTLYTNTDAILRAGGEISARINSIPTRGPLPGRQGQLEPHQDLKRILFFLCDLVYIIGPVTGKHCEYYVGNIFGKVEGMNVLQLLALGRSLGLLKADSDPHTANLFFHRPARQNGFQSFMREDFIDIAAERARILSTYQRIDEAWSFVRRISD